MRYDKPYALLLLIAAFVLASPARAQLAFSTFLGGSGNDYVHHVIADGSGSLYVTGRTAAADFPTTPGAFDPTYNGGDHDVFVAKLNATGTTLLWSTFLGGSGDDQPAMLAFDSTGGLLVIGVTSSTDFPVAGGALQAANAGQYDVFLSRLTLDGTALPYSTYFGGSQSETVAGLALDATGRIAIAGTTTSPDLPTSAGVLQPAYAGGLLAGDMFVAKLSANATSVEWCTYLGGAHEEECRGVAMASTGEVFVAGWTARNPALTGPDFPTTPGAFDTTYAGDRDVAVAKLSADGTALLYGTLAGGADKDQANSVCLLGDGSLIVGGDTASSSFPTTAGTLREVYAGGRDVFVLKLTPTADALAWSTFLGGSAEEGYGAVATDPSGNVIVSGYTLSTDFPTSIGAFQTALSGQSDVFLVKLTPDATALGYGTYFGGSLTDRGGAGVDADGNAILVGFTASPGFPITAGAYQTAIGAGWCGFVAKINPSRITTRLFTLARTGAINTLTYLRAYLYRSGTTPISGKQVDFALDGVHVGVETTNVDGRATLSYTIPEASGAGERTINAAFAGDAAFNASGASAKLTATKGSCTVWVLSRSVVQGGAAYLRAYVRRLPDYAWLEGRTIDISLDGTYFGTAVTTSSGVASVLFQCPPAYPLGGHPIGASFAGDAGYGPASGSGILTVLP